MKARFLKIIALPVILLLFSAHSSSAQDAGCTMVVSPAAGSTLILNSSYTVTLRIENFGTTTLTSIPVKFSLNGLGNTPLNETWTGSLDPGDSTDYTFASQFTLTDASDTSGYGIADLVGDTWPPNNLATVIYVFPGGPTSVDQEEESSRLSIEPIFPNPTSDNLSLIISGNADGKNIKVSLLTIEGKILKEFEYSAPHDNLEVNLNIANLPAGLYFIGATTGYDTVYRKFVK
ncbi:MAG TPA: T9SS type A sorting domain-containing protein [Flavobacteriales bacterium]|nr:T9SS type A sorting domain-containing protein [Flavobacteriales bacterium]